MAQVLPKRLCAAVCEYLKRFLLVCVLPLINLFALLN